MAKKINKDSRRNRLYAAAWLLFILEVAGFAAVFIYLASLAVLPFAALRKVLFIALAVVAVQLILLLVAAKKKPAGSSKINIAISAVLVVALLVSGVGTALIYGKLNNIEQGDATHTMVTAYTLNDGGLHSLWDVRGRKMGVRDIIDTETTELALRDITEKIGSRPETAGYADFISQVEALRSGEVDAILVNEAFKSIIIESVPDFEEWAKPVYQLKVEISGEVEALRAKVATEPFVIYLSGLDTSGGEITDYGNSDVNMLMVVNPVTKKIAIVNIPRDYYVGLYGDSNKMDKLTHAGAHGVDCSIATVSALFGVDINYFIKVNFDSVVQIIDALGGVTVYSDVAFSSRASHSETRYSFVEGENQLTGDSALAFARERYSFTDGDRQRGRNQQKVIDAVIQKVTSPAVITGFSGLLDAVTQNMKTSLTVAELNSLIQMQLTDMASWDINTLSVDGYNSSAVTYSGGSAELYVMRPNYETVEAAKQAISQTMALE